MQDRNWFMHPPFGTWHDNLISLVQWHALHGRSYEEIINIAECFEPQNGWDGQSKQFLKSTTKFILRNANELPQGR